MMNHVERIALTVKLNFILPCQDQACVIIMILVCGTITVAALETDEGNTNIQVKLKNCAPFTDWISEIKNTQIDNAKHIDVIIPIYNLIEYKDNYWKTSGSLW